MVARGRINAQHFRAMDAVERGKPTWASAMQDVIDWGYAEPSGDGYRLTEEGKRALRTWREMEDR